MIKQLLTGLFFTLLIAVSAGVQAQQKWMDIHIIQGDDVYTPGAGKDSIVLQKKTFRIQVLLQHTSGVYVFASFHDSLYRLSENIPVPDLAGLPYMAMAEEEFNREKELIVDDEGWSYWFYDPKMTWHRFNKKIILLDSGRVVGTKTIKQLFLPPSNETLRLKDNSSALYLFFLAIDKETADGKPETELLRRRIKIDWRDED